MECGWWVQLTETQRWQIVSCLKTSEPLGATASAPVDSEISFEIVPALKRRSSTTVEKPGQIHKSRKRLAYTVRPVFRPTMLL
jgi:hypothetical protein